MSTLNVANLELQITRKIANATDNKELAILNKALYVLQTGVIFTVGTFANLPSASENEGKLYFVEADALLYFSFVPEYSSAAQWIPITNVSANILWGWGCNNGNQLGTGSGNLATETSPVSVAGINNNWIDIATLTQTASSSSAGLKSDGTLWTWGSNGSGQLGDGTTVARCSPGTTWGSATTWCQVSGGGVANITAIKTDGTMWTWGTNSGNSSGVLGDGTTVNRCSPGTTWGSYTNWCQVSNGDNHATAIKRDGTLWTWGRNNSGQLGDGTTVSRCSPGTVAGGGTTWCEVSGGYKTTAAIKTDGTLWTWGNNLRGQLGDGTTVSRCSPGTIAGGGTTWCQAYATIAIKTDGTLWTWGSNCCGALGDGTIVSRSSPGTVAGGGTTWCRVASGSGNDISSSAAIKTDGTLWTWGCRVGDGTIITRCSPGTIVGGGTTWFKASIGGNFILALTKETL